VSVGTAHSEILLLVHVCSRAESERGREEKVGREVGESIRTRVERRKKRKERKSGIQWPVSSHGTYVMPDVNVREREKNSCDRDEGAKRKREIQERSNWETRSRTSCGG